MKKAKKKDKKTGIGWDEIVECEQCGCLIRKENAQKVETFVYGLYYQEASHGFKYFCKKDKKPFDIIRRERSKLKFYKKEPAQEVEVDEGGRKL